MPEPPGRRDPESAEFLLFDAFTQFVRGQAEHQPWVIVLDDLHWADEPTLQLLLFMARALSTMPVLIVGTYRDTELTRTHPLSETLAELNREGGFQRIVLKGLTSEEVTSYVRKRASVEPSPALLSRIVEETEGNPFFLSEVVNLMVEEGTLENDSVSDISLPDGVREALGRRLDRLSADANELLQMAAVVGREFAYDTVALLGDRDDDWLLGRLEEGLAARVIEESDRPGRYAFTHALMQETLLDELSLTRRVRLHGQVGEALERRWGDGASEHPALLALHFALSATLSAEHEEKARRYLRLAGRQAEERNAWADAVQQYERLLAVETPDGERASTNARLLVDLGRTRIAVSDFRGAMRALWRALDLLEADAVWPQYAEAALILSSVSYNVLDPARQRPVLRLALDRLPDGQSELGARLTIRLAKVVDDLSIAGPLLSEGRETARQLGLEDVLAEADAVEGLHLHNQCDPEAMPLLNSAVNQLEHLGYYPLAAETAMNLRTMTEVTLGSAAALEVANRQIELGRRVRQPLYVADGTMYQLAISLHRGELERVAQEEGAALEQFGWHFLMRGTMSLCALLRGDRARAIELLPTATGGESWQSATLHSYRAWVLAHVGEFDEVDTEVENALRLIAQSKTPLFQIPIELNTLNAAVTAHADRWRDEALRVVETPELTQGHAVAGSTGSIALQRAEIGLMIELPAERVEGWFQEALDFSENEGFVIDRGRAHLGLAAVAQLQGDSESARRQLDAAGEMFSRHGAKLYLDQVIAKKQILKA